MNTQEKCDRLADEIRKILSRGFTLSNEVIHYIDSTFSNPSAADLQSILADDSNCEADSLMELLMFPDEAIQFQLEPLLERLQFQNEDERLVLDQLFKGSLRTTIRFPQDGQSMHLEVTEEAASQFVSRLNISKRLASDLLKILNGYDDENVSRQIKVKLRNSQLLPSAEKIGFLCLFFKKFNPQDNDIFECLEFVVGFLEDLRKFNDIYQALMAKKKFYFISLQKAKQMESQLQKHNVETLLARGKRVVLIDQQDARKKMRIIDRISRALYGKTDYFEPLNGDEELLELGPDQNVRDVIRRLV
jgi:hypothetical protein